MILLFRLGSESFEVHVARVIVMRCATGSCMLEEVSKLWRSSLLWLCYSIDIALLEKGEPSLRGYNFI